jgi:purine-nucleoside phosphorylase
LLRALAGGDIACAIVLGSGLASAFRGHPDLQAVSYADIGDLPEPRAKGHVGEALVGTLGGKRIVAFCGRFHLYEGRTPAEVVSLVELGIAAGAKTLIVTNAAGGLQRTYAPGDVMIIRDHLNLTGMNPLATAQLPAGISERFVNMSDAYDASMRDIALVAGPRHGLRVQQGVYAGLLGPSFETPAEVAMLRTLGADAVGMSTVLETIAARARGVAVFGASLITNVHDGQPTNSDEVNEEGGRAAPSFAGMITDIVAELPV